MSGAFPFLFATNLFPQYRLNCFLRVQKHRSAEGILDIGEQRKTAKHNISKNALKVFSHKNDIRDVGSTADFADIAVFSCPEQLNR